MSDHMIETMHASNSLSVRSARASDSKVETPDRLLSRQTLQRIATRMGPMIGGIGAILLGTGFLIAIYLHWSFCARHSAKPLVTRQSSRTTFSRLSLCCLDRHQCPLK